MAQPSKQRTQATPKDITRLQSMLAARTQAGLASLKPRRAA